VGRYIRGAKGPRRAPEGVFQTNLSREVRLVWTVLVQRGRLLVAEHFARYVLDDFIGFLLLRSEVFGLDGTATLHFEYC